MSAPVITVYQYNSPGTRQETWNAGTVAADQTSQTTLSVLIWNNRAGSTNISHLRECVLSIEDTSATVTDVVTKKWVKAKLGLPTTDTDITTVTQNTQNQSYNKWFPVGGTGTDKTVLYVRPSDTAALTANQYSDLSCCTLSGDLNSGSLNDKANYALVSLWMAPPQNSEPGSYNVVAKISGFYT